MQDAEWIIIAGFLSIGGFTFLRLAAGARRAAIARAAAEAAWREYERKRAEQLEQLQQGGVPEVAGAIKMPHAESSSAEAR